MYKIREVHQLFYLLETIFGASTASQLSNYSLCSGWETADQCAILHSAFFLLNRQRKNSTGNASHHILSWWMCWPRPCMSCFQPPTVSLCLPLRLITHRKQWQGIRHDYYNFAFNKNKSQNLQSSQKTCNGHFVSACFVLPRFSSWAEKSLFPVLQAWWTVRCRPYWTPLSVSIK